MFALYKYNAGSTNDSIMADITAIITGTTNINDLSANCDKVASSIHSSICPSSWTLHDNINSNSKVFKAQCVEGENKFLIIKFDDTYMKLSFCEDWNNTTHTATNLMGFLNTTSTIAKVDTGDNYMDPSNITPSIGGYIYIYATAKEILLRTRSGATWSTSTVHLVETTRVSPNMQKSRGYPCVSLKINNYNSNNCLRMYNGASDSITGLYTVIAGPGGMSTYMWPFNNQSDKVTGVYIPVMAANSLSVFLVNTYYNIVISSIIDRLGFLVSDGLIGGTIGATLDEMTVNGVTYINLGSNIITQNNTFWVPKG